MILELIILMLLLWFYSGSYDGIASQEVQLNGENERERERDNLLRSIKRDIDNIVGSSVNCTLVESKTKTYVTNKETIHLLVACSQTGKLYPRQTLLYATLHEVAHVLCPDTGHSNLFFQIEEDLISSAIRKGYIDENFSPDATYPCYDE